jgi:hypothetical protein
MNSNNYYNENKYYKLDTVYPNIDCLFCLSEGKPKNMKRTPANHLQQCIDCNREWYNGILNEYPIKKCKYCDKKKNRAYVILKYYDGKSNAQLCSYCNSKWIKGVYQGNDNSDIETTQCLCLRRFFRF